MKPALDWLDQRTGWKKLVNEALFENVPGGSRWRYVWGSTLTFAISVQFITGIFLWMAYSPSSQTAWESVYYIQHEMDGGWILRGIHHWMAQAMTVLLVLHLMQVLIDGAYKAPREVNFWTGIILLKLVLALSLTGYLLPWDQKGYWATKVATNIAGIVPFVGGAIQRLIVGGPDYGHHTLTRFFALHAGVLPALIVATIGGHIYLFRRHGLTEAKSKLKPKRKDQAFWPDQVFKDAVACLAVFVTVMILVYKFHGAHLYAPADPSESFSAARPDWYFMFLFQFLKYFPGTSEIWGAIVIPGLAMAVIFLMPIVGRWKSGHRWNLGIIAGLLLSAAWLTWLAFLEDVGNPLLGFLESLPGESETTGGIALPLMAMAATVPALIFLRKRFGFRVHVAVACLIVVSVGLTTRLAFKQDTGNPGFIAAQVEARANADRVVELARGLGVPQEGAVFLLRNDPLTQGPRVFAEKCASCHRYAGHDGKGNLLKDPQTAPDLEGFGGRAWLTEFLSAESTHADGETLPIATEKFYGGTEFSGGQMARFVKRKIKKFDADELKMLRDAIIALSAEAKLKSQAAMDSAAAGKGGAIERGKTAFLDEIGCADCHQFHFEDEDTDGPNLTGWASREWMISFVSDPTHADFYGEENDRMPSFGKDEVMTQREIELVVDWLRGEWHVAPKPAEH
ncbi:MAG: quinol-cytochrome oxidoreductase complex cytochrome b subunit/mono [Limisphaerales bacterium]|jgi:quinol-cytochrome oxidoreductase complex cytochrome b subunit/mono/diheme cytochrome c family protein